MVRQRTKNKKSVYYRQYQGGYAKVPASELRALMEGYKQKIFRRNEVRVFAARWEAVALHKESRVSLYRIVNCDSKKKGNRRLSQSQIDNASTKLDDWLPILVEKTATQSTKRTKPVARRVLRHVARGGATTVEGLFMFAYFMRRISQRKPMQRLLEHEHYARFRYADFEEWTGVSRATQSRLLVRIMHRGYINTLAIHKENESFNGQLFIDGQALSLVRLQQLPRRERPRAATSECKKKSTPPRLLVNTPHHKRSTPIRINPKTNIEKEKDLLQGIKSGALASHGNPEMRRIALKAIQLLENQQRQAA